MMTPEAIKSFLGWMTAALYLLLPIGCTSIIVNPILDPLTLSLQKETDLQLLQEGAPSLLLLLDGLAAGDPDNMRLKLTAAKAYTAYATIIYETGQTERAATMSRKARDYGIGLLTGLPGLERIDGMTLDDLKKALAKVTPDQVGSLFWGAYGWATWIQFQEGSPAAMADLPIVEQLMLRVVALDESYYHGGAHIFLGSYYGSRPQIYGGKPEISRLHFERALTLNNRQFLLTQIAYAQTYARIMFDRELYLQLLTEVLVQPVRDSDTASSNKLAKTMAAKLIDQVDEYF